MKSVGLLKLKLQALKPKKPKPPIRHVVIPRGYTGLGFYQTDSVERTMPIGSKTLKVRASRRSNIAPGLNKAHYNGFIFVAHASRLYMFVGNRAQSGAGVFSLRDGDFNVLVNVEIT